MRASGIGILAEKGELFTCASPTIKAFVHHLSRRTFERRHDDLGHKVDERQDFILDLLPSDPFRLFIKRGSLTYTVNIGKGKVQEITTSYKKYIKEEINNHLENTSYLSTKERKERAAREKQAARKVQRDAEAEERRKKKAAEKRARDIETRKKQVEKGKELQAKEVLKRQKERAAKAEAEAEKKAKEEKGKKRKLGFEARLQLKNRKLEEERERKRKKEEVKKEQERKKKEARDKTLRRRA